MVPITEAELARINRWLADKKVDMECTACGEAQWEVRQVLSVPVRTAQELVSPLIQLTCDNCGHVRLFDGLKIGFEEGATRLGD
ncbi:MAG: hypothetical protein M3220_15355 [Chloroflexota bacterium]|nr:hypothetical protein [Chloroflexota bacterium]